MLIRVWQVEPEDYQNLVGDDADFSIFYFDGFLVADNVSYLKIELGLSILQAALMHCHCHTAIRSLIPGRLTNVTVTILTANLQYSSMCI